MTRPMKGFSLPEPHFEAFFEFESKGTEIAKIRGFDPEFKDSDIVLPIEITTNKGASLTLGFAMDVEHLRAMLEEYDATHAFPDVIE